MTFGEKLFKLRKENGLSQEALAEKLNTSRQAISKWENGQGFPETEKLLLIGNIFEVSIDYLLKDTPQQSYDIDEGYYVSKEMAEGYLLQERKISKYLALGFSLLILSTVPYLVFKQEPAIYTFLIIIIATLGIGMFVSAAVSTDGGKYKILSKEVLMFDQNYLKELKARYENIKKKVCGCNDSWVLFHRDRWIVFFIRRKSYHFRSFRALLSGFYSFDCYWCLHCNSYLTITRFI